jgi:hypothetical protein
MWSRCHGGQRPAPVTSPIHRPSTQGTSKQHRRPLPFSAPTTQLRVGAQEEALSSEPMTREVQEQRRSPGSASAGGAARVEWLAGGGRGVRKPEAEVLRRSRGAGLSSSSVSAEHRSGRGRPGSCRKGAGVLQRGCSGSAEVHNAHARGSGLAGIHGSRFSEGRGGA